MTFRRVLVAAPLSVIVALAAHFVGFGADHAFGGPHSTEVLGLGLAGSLLLALAATFWLALTESDAKRGERTLLRLMPGRGSLPAAAALLSGSGFVAFAAGELIEGRSPLGTWSTGLALALVATLVAAGAQRLVRWLAAGAVALFKWSSERRVRAAALRRITLEREAPLLPITFARAPSRGRAPPQLA